MTSHIFVIGINYRQVPLSERSKAAVAKEAYADTLIEAKSLSSMEEIAFLSTCNRVEYYGYGHGQALMHWLNRRHPELYGNWFFHKDRTAVRHLFRVASGLDSAILGEPQITGQVKRAYFEAKKARTLGAVLHRVFERAFHTSKRARTETAVSVQPLSFASIAVNLVHRVYDLTKQPHIVILGAGEMAKLCLLHFQAHGALVTIASRNIARAEELAQNFGVKAKPFSSLSHLLGTADAVITATASSKAIITPALLQEARQHRLLHPLVLVDLAVPRSIDPAVSTLSGIFLYDIDMLSKLAEEANQARQHEAKSAERIVDEEVQRFWQWLEARKALPMLHLMQAHAKRAQTKALRRAQQMLAKGASPEESLAFLADLLTKKYLHVPLVALTRADHLERQTLESVLWSVYEHRHHHERNATPALKRD